MRSSRSMGASLSPIYSFTIDHPMQSYSPHHNRPDIVQWSDLQREMWLFELTISYESLVVEAQERKRAKYQDLVKAGRAVGYRTELITVEVGSRGMLGPSSLGFLSQAIGSSQKDIANLCQAVIRTSLLGSFKIWCSRNSVNKISLP